MPLSLPWTFSKDDPAGPEFEDRLQEVLDTFAQQFPVGNSSLSNRVVRGTIVLAWAAAQVSGVGTVTHGLGVQPAAILATVQAIGSGQHAFAEIGNQNATTFQVQGWATAAFTGNLTVHWVAYS
jgi:hypothetical protein